MHAIVIVDLQRAFSIPPELIAKIERRAHSFPLRVFTRFENPAGSLFRRKLDLRSCPPGSRESELVLATRDDDLVFLKPRYGLTTDQVQELKSRGVTKALVCGIETDACVLAVAFSLFDNGVDCEIDPALCWSSTGLHEAALQIMREQFATAEEPANANNRANGAVTAGTVLP